MPTVVVAGGGVAGLEGLVTLRSRLADRARLVLISPQPAFGLRAWSVAEPFSSMVAGRYDVGELAGELGARFVRGAVEAVDTDRSVLRLVNGDIVNYDRLLLAIGSVPEPGLEHGITFERSQDPEAFDELLDDLRTAFAKRIAYVVPDGATWTLPAYELALNTAMAFGAGAEISLVTYEQEPLEIFGPEAWAMMREELARAGIELHTRAHPETQSHQVLQLGDHRIMVDRIVALPVPDGPRLSGLPADAHGFLPVDDHCRVIGVAGVNAAGDGTAQPIKQGGLAAQQAAVAAEDIAVSLGSGTRAEPYRPVLRAMLSLDRGPVYIRAEQNGDGRVHSTVSQEPLWWPPSKVASRWLVPWLASRAAAGRVDVHLGDEPDILAL